MYRKLVFASILAVMVGSSALAQSARVRVTKATGGKSLVNWAGFTAGQDSASRAFIQTLERDLLRSGWFQLTRSGAGEYALSGSAVVNGANVQVECSVHGADGRRQFGRSYKHPGSQASQLAHRVADDIVEAITGRKGIASTRLAMVSNRSGKKEIYLCNADGSGLQQLTRDDNVSVAPKWGPEGKRLLYTGFLKVFPDVFMIHLATGDRRRVAHYPGLNTGGILSPNGKEMAVILSKDGNPELYVKNLGSGALTRLTKTRHAAEASPSWSPDGRRIVYVSDRTTQPQLYMVSRSGGKPARLTSRGSQNVAPDWGPSNLIAFSSRIGGQYAMCVLDPDAGAVKQLPLDGADYEDPSWAPDGRHIACTRSENYRSKVYILDTMGDAPVALLPNTGGIRGDWFTPSWSPQ